MRARLILVATFVPIFLAAQSTGRTRLVGGERAGYPTITAALAASQPGDTVRVRAGTYREANLTVATPRLVLIGDSWPVLDGENARNVLLVTADDVTVRGFEVKRTGVSNIEDRAGIRVRDASGCVIEGNRLRENLFGIYLQRASRCRVRDNDITAVGVSQTLSGNGIHLWYSPDAHVEHNRISGHRDGIYFEFSARGSTRDNISEHNQRYGLHFMYSDSCHYVGNDFRDNTSGVAVMYSRGVVIDSNKFERSWGSAAYGLLLKEILGGTLRGNQFVRNSIGLYVEGASHMDIAGNSFLQNGWAIKAMATAEDDHFHGNIFAGNAFDVVTNTRRLNSTFDGNWWDAYRGYDLNHDGIGDIPFRPVRLFALIVEQHPTALLLLRSPLVTVLDAAERVLPVLTPEAVVDLHPLMRVPR
jgi:nitrous oxidase accessory protein